MDRLPNPKKFVSERKKEIVASKVNEELTDSEKAQVAEDILKAVEKDTGVKFKGAEHDKYGDRVIIKIGNGKIEIGYRDPVSMNLKMPEYHTLPFDNSQGTQFKRDRIQVLSYYMDNYDKSNLKKAISKI